MQTKLFYFSATGNSLAWARRISAGLGDAELISIPRVLQEPVTIDVERIGLVFPIYAWGMPRIVHDFVKRLQIHTKPYLFAVATCAGVPGRGLKELAKTIRKNGGVLAAGFVVKETSHALLSRNNPLIATIGKFAGQISQTGQARLAEILTTIKNSELHGPETSPSALGNLIASSIHGTALQAFKSSDKDFWVTESCTTCQICVRVCPRNNIRIIDGRPAWQHNCELCFGCAQWCPNEAIQYQTGSSGKPRSHNPEVTVQDLLVR